jgi:hypothetical protein
MYQEALEALLRRFEEPRSWRLTPQSQTQTLSPSAKASAAIAEWERVGNAAFPLDLSSLGLRTLPPLPPTVQRLYCSSNRLTELPPLPPALRVLHADSNQLQSLPPLPVTLQEVVIARNSLETLPPLPSTLQHLYTSFCHLRTLPELPPTLLTLSVAGNCLRSLPPLPPTLRHLDLDQNPIEHLSVPFPPTLQKLSTLLTALPHTLHYSDDTAEIARYAEELDAAQDALEAPPRVHARTELVKEELVAAAWRPERVEKWLEAGLDVAAL